MIFRSAGLLLVLALAVTGCTRTAMYHPPGDDDPRARLSIESQLGSNAESGGWQMPGAGESTVAIFKVDGWPRRAASNASSWSPVSTVWRFSPTTRAFCASAP